MTKGVRAPRAQRLLTSLGCVYELVALWTPLPTITNLVHRYPVLKPVVMTVLDDHFIPRSAA